MKLFVSAPVGKEEECRGESSIAEKPAYRFENIEAARPIDSPQPYPRLAGTLRQVNN